jgi:hypothetical protein
MPFKPHDRAFADNNVARIEPASLPGFAATTDDARLRLLLPDALPIEQSLGETERAMLRGALVSMLRALELSDRSASLRQLDALLARLVDEDGDPARIEETGIPADAAHVHDFDSYFRVERISSPQQAQALVRGLAQTARAAMSLFARAPHLPEARVQQQIAGFATYTHLLARTFDLGELS